MVQNIITIQDFGTWARLGNQMFQYAYLKSLSIDRGFKIKLPINQSGHGYTKPQFFDAFDLNIEILDQKDSFDTIIDETSIVYDEKFKSENIPSKNIVFNGYFQSEKYFLKHEDIIKCDFTFKEHIRNTGLNFINSIRVHKKQLVALHVRRTDNLSSNSPTVLVKNIFRDNAINYLLNKIEDIHLLIFSDDKQWCRDNLKYNVSQTIVDGLTDIEEMYTMSLCDHFIIGSSTFSWWAAWLSSNKDKIIITPDKWFNNKLAGQEKDLIPLNWILLES